MSAKNLGTGREQPGVLARCLPLVAGQPRHANADRFPGRARVVYMHSAPRLLILCFWSIRLRGIIITLVILFVIGHVAATFEGPRSRSRPASGEVAGQWRRTRSGWELRSNWQHAFPILDPSPIAWRLHPALVAMLQLLISILALAWSETSPRPLDASSPMPGREGFLLRRALQAGCPLEAPAERPPHTVHKKLYTTPPGSRTALRGGMARGPTGNG